MTSNIHNVISVRNKHDVIMFFLQFLTQKLVFPPPVLLLNFGFFEVFLDISRITVSTLVSIDNLIQAWFWAYYLYHVFKGKLGDCTLNNIVYLAKWSFLFIGSKIIQFMSLHKFRDWLYNYPFVGARLNGLLLSLSDK